MMLEKDGYLEPNDLPEVLLLARHHSQAGIAAILSEKKDGLITDLDVLMFLHNCKKNLLKRVTELRGMNQGETAEQLLGLIHEVFPPTTATDEEDHEKERD